MYDWYQVRNLHFGHFMSWVYTTTPGARLISGRGVISNEDGTPVKKAGSSLGQLAWGWRRLHCGGKFVAWAYMNDYAASSIAAGSGEARTVAGVQVAPTLSDLLC